MVTDAKNGPFEINIHLCRIEFSTHCSFGSWEDSVLRIWSDNWLAEQAHISPRYKECNQQVAVFPTVVGWAYHLGFSQDVVDVLQYTALLYTMIRPVSSLGLLCAMSIAWWIPDYSLFVAVMAAVYLKAHYAMLSSILVPLAFTIALTAIAQGEKPALPRYFPGCYFQAH